MKMLRSCVYNAFKSEIKGEGSKHIDSDLYGGFILLFNLLRIDNRKIERPEHPACLRERNAIRKRHVSKIHELCKGPCFPVRNQSLRI